MNPLMIKYGIYAAAVAVIIGTSWYTLNTWHYSPLEHKSAIIVKHEATIVSKDVIINDLSVKIQSLIEKNKVVGFEEFYKGYIDENVSDSTDSRFIF